MRFVVHGHVQGVGYRAATRRKALGWALQGWVFNRDDGCVEGVVAGPAEARAAFRRWLAVGPPLARVSQVEWLPSPEQPDGPFVVRK